MTSSEWLVWKNVNIPVENGLAKLPCDLIRLLKTFDDRGCVVSARRNGEMLHAPFKCGTLTIHYYSLPLVDDGEGNMVPKLLYEYSDWYKWYVIHTILMDEWLLGNLTSDRWAYIDQMYDAAFDQAIGSIDLLSITDLEEQLFMMRNGIFYDNNFIG